MEAFVVLALLGVASFLLCRDSVPVDVVALGVLVVLTITGILTPREALAGFSNDAVIAIAGLFVLTAALRTSGALDLLGRRMRRVAENQPQRALVLLLVVVAAVSAFINNTTCTAVFLPIAVALGRDSGLPTSRILMPMAFASILGGSITLVGTSTNVLVSGLLSERGDAALGMFELAPVALPIAVLGLLYVVLAGRLLPHRGADDLEEAYHIVDYLSEATVAAGSPLIGNTVAGSGIGRRWGLNLVGLVRGKQEPQVPQPDDALQMGDVLLLQGRADRLIEMAETERLEIGKDVTAAEGLHLAEAVVLPRSDLVGRSLVEARFRQRYSASVLALHRDGEDLVESIARIRIRVGDVLLVQHEGPASRRLLAQRGLVLLDEASRRPRRGRITLVAPLLFMVALVPVVFGILALPTSILLGCLLMLVTRCITPQEAYAAIEWRLLVLIAGMIALGRALEVTGAAEMLAGATVQIVGDLGPTAVLAGFYFLTLALTQPMSNQAAALVVLPIALQFAEAADIGTRAMAVTVALAASSSFLTPLEPSCLLVYGPGRYRFLDYPRFGAFLTVLAFVLTIVLVPRFWPV